MFKQWQPSTAELAAMIILAILPLTFPLSILWRCAIWSVAWLLFLHLLIWQLKVTAPLPLSVKILLGVGLTGLLVACIYVPVRTIWREEKAAALSGELEAPSSDQRYEDSDAVLQIGPEGDGTRFKWTGEKGKPMLTVVGDNLSIRRENGKLLLTTHVRDQSGAIVVDIVDNVWTISSAQNVSWEKNYTRNALEVQDRRGRVVFQVVLMPDAMRLQGEWWNENGNGGRVMRPYPFDRVKTGPIFVVMTPLYHPDEPLIEPIFKYPSKEHWGEFVDWVKP